MAWDGRIFGFSANPIDYAANALHKGTGGNLGYDADLHKGVSVGGGDRSPTAGVSVLGSSVGLQSPTSGVRTVSNPTGDTRNTGGTDTLGDGGGAPTGGGGGAALPVLNQAAIDNTQRALNEIPGLLEAALRAESQRRANTLRAFEAQEQQQRGTYDKSTTTNQLNYDANYMDSIRAGVGGLGGLMNILRGTGAAGGTAEDIVRDTVGGVTAQDIRTGADTQQANQGQLDTVLSNFLTELKGKRNAADETFENNQRAIRRDSQSQMQDLYGKMAGYYGDADRTAEYNNFMAKAGELTPQIARNSRAVVNSYDAKPVQVQAPQLTAFADPSQPDVAVAPQDGQLGTGIFTMNNRREREQQDTPMAMPVGA